MNSGTVLFGLWSWTGGREGCGVDKTGAVAEVSLTRLSPVIAMDRVETTKSLVAAEDGTEGKDEVT